MISAKGIGKQFDGQWLFRDLSVEIQKNESVVLMGPSGSGKSLLLKILSGLLPADAGTVELKTKKIGMLFQRNALFDYLTVAENLLFPLKEVLGITGLVAQQKVTRFLSAVGLKGSEHLYPDEISGGMQKRLGIARALILDPEVIFYDEPTAGLDPITSKTIAVLIQSLQKETGSALLTVTNDLERAYTLGNRFYLLAQGEWVSGGTAEQLKASTHPMLRQFVYGFQCGPLTGTS